MFAILPIIPLIYVILLLILKGFSGPNLKTQIGWFTLPVPLVLFGIYLSYLPKIAGGQILCKSYPWVKALGLDFAFRLDGLSMLFALLITLIGTLVTFYSIFYLDKRERLFSFYCYLLIFMGAMLGVTTCDNLILLYMFWELTSISSFLLIGFWFEKERSRYGAQKALLITVAGGMCLLVAFLLIGQITGTFQISTLLSHPRLLLESPLYPAIAILLMLGAFTKSAQVPFHIWLPSAMEAPTPISCYLHSATMVKAGIFLIARFTPIMSGTALWNGTILTIGLASLFFGSFMALRQKDLKALLAYSTISQLGLIVSLLGMGTQAAILAALFHLLNHSVFKGSLFLMTGIVDHAAGTRDMTLLKGLGKIMPATAAICMIGAFSMAGLPPFSGFLSKELFFEAAQSVEVLQWAGPGSWMIPTVAVLASILTFVYSISMFFKVFWSGKTIPEFDHLPHHPHEAGKGLLFAPFFLVSFNLIIALAPNFFAKTLIGPAVMAVEGTETLPHFHISFWHGITLPLFMTLIVVAAGLLIYRNLDAFKSLIGKVSLPFGSEKAYNRGISVLPESSKRLTDFYMTGSLTNYLLLILFFTLLLAVIPLFRSHLLTTTTPSDLAAIAPIDLFLFIVTAGSAIMAMVFKRRLYAILALSVTGYMISLFFVIFSAPDLALTQLLTESITLVLYLLVLRELPKGMEPETPTPTSKKAARIAISVSCGLLVTFLSIAAHVNKSAEPISWYYLQYSKKLSGGNNVVNTLLVDFRGLDTLGEITVLLIAALGVLMLIRLVTTKDGHTITLKNTPLYYSRLERDLGKHFIVDEATKNSNNVIMILLSKPLSFIILVVAIYLFSAGHNLPGGGFVAGLMASCAFLVLYLTMGRSVLHNLRIDMRMFLPLGLTFSGGFGFLGILFGKPFLTHTFGEVTLPLIGHLELATAMIFDFGVFLVVIGTVMCIIFGIGGAQRA